VIFIEGTRDGGRDPFLCEDEHAPDDRSARSVSADFVARAHDVARFDALPVDEHTAARAGGPSVRARLEGARCVQELIDPHVIAHGFLCAFRHDERKF
jgi:hypothetical protein